MRLVYSVIGVRDASGDLRRALVDGTSGNRSTASRRGSLHPQAERANAAAARTSAAVIGAVALDARVVNVSRARDNGVRSA